MAIVYEQSRFAYSTADSFGLAFSSNVKSGSLIIALLTEYDASGVSADAVMSDSQTNTYVKAGNLVNSTADGVAMEFWYTFASSAGALTVTANPQRSSNALTIHEFSGISSSSPVINVQDNNVGMSDAVTAGPITTTVANTLLFAAMTSTAYGSAANEGITPDGDYIQTQENEDGDTANVTNTMYRIVSSTLTDTANWTLSANWWYWIGWVVAFKASSTITGSTAWGHVTGVTETNVRTFTSNWSGTGSISGTGDSEYIAVSSGQYMESEVVATGGRTVQLLQNNYASGDTVTIKYRHGTTEAECLAASYSTYSAPFDSSGYVQVRVESTL